MQGQQNPGSFIPDTVPLPNEVPLPPRLSDIPSRVLHSATVETLIQHTDDLTSRLKVHLRRGAELEARILELEDRLSEVSHQRDSVFAQIEVLKEKDRTSSERSQAAEARTEALRRELELAQTEIRSLHAHLNLVRSDLNRHQRYQRRIQNWIRPLLNQKNQALKQAWAAQRVLESEREALMAKAQISREDFEHQRKEAESRLAKLKGDQAALVEHYESQMKRSELQINELKGRLAQAEQKTSAFDTVSTESARANNEKIYFERRAKELETELAKEKSRLTQTVDDLAAECASLRAGLESARESKEKIELERDAAERSRLKAESQLQGLRSVFKDLTDKVDRLQTQNDALERINESLSQQLTQSRSEVHVQLSNQSLDRVGFSEDRDSSKSKAVDHQKIEGLLSELEMKAFGIRPEHLSRTPGAKSGTNKKDSFKLNTPTPSEAP